MQFSFDDLFTTQNFEEVHIKVNEYEKPEVLLERIIKASSHLISVMWCYIRFLGHLLLML